MKLLLYILCISPLLWAYSCKKEPCIPTKYTFTEQDLEWQIYQIGQQYKYKNLTTGEIRIYTVSKIEKSIIKADDGFSSGRDRCPRNPREIESIKVQLLTDKLEQLNITFQALSTSIYPNIDTNHSNALMFISFQDFGLTIGNPSGEIDFYGSSFVDGQPISNAPSVFFYKTYICNNQVFNNVFLNSIKKLYYNKKDGVIEFRINNEIWQRIVE